MRNRKKPVFRAIGVACCLYGLSAVSAQAGVTSALNDLVSLAGSALQTILDVGKVLNTGQMQQMSANEQEQNQVLQEQSMAAKELAAAQARQDYLSQTDTLAQLPGGICAQAQAGSGFLQSDQSAAAQGADGGAAMGNEGGPGVVDGAANLPTQQEKLQALSALFGGEVDAHALFEGKDSGNALAVESTLLNPIPSQPITLAQSTTPAGVRWQATHNSAEAGLSIASSSMGLVAGLHAISVPGSAVSAVASVAVTASSAGATAGPSLSSVATRAPANPPAPTSAGNWQALVPRYASQIAQVAAEENISPAIIAATIAHEDGSENLSAMPCGNPTSYGFGGASSLICEYANPKLDSTAKSLGQMIDATAIGDGANYGLTNPMVVYGKNPMIELRAMASGLKTFLSQCGGNVACAFGAWYYGSVVPGMTNGAWPNKATGQYAARSMQFYTGQKQIDVGSYQGGSSGSSNASPASTAGLLRLVSLGSYANPAFYTRLAVISSTGAWRTAIFLKAMDIRVSNQNRRLMERLSAIMATRVALAENRNIRGQNALRGNAAAEANGAMR